MTGLIHRHDASSSLSPALLTSYPAESFFKILKVEEVRLKTYETVEEAGANIGRFIEDVYNARRLHSSLRHLPPAKFETAHTAAAVAAQTWEPTLAVVR